MIKLEKRTHTDSVVKKKKNWRDQMRLSPSCRNKILSFLIRFPQILHELPREGQIRDIKSVISCGGFHPKCLKRVQSREREGEGERERDHCGQKKIKEISFLLAC